MFIHNIPLISRDSYGQLINITPEQKKKVRSMIVSKCCNYDSEHGECVLLENGCGAICPQMVSGQLLCRWFNHAVLPDVEELYAEIIPAVNRKKCTVCGTGFIPGSNRSKYCPVCRKKIHRRQKTESERKRRNRVDN